MVTYFSRLNSYDQEKAGEEEAAETTPQSSPG